jgi:hypothetical protein
MDEPSRGRVLRLRAITEHVVCWNAAGKEFAMSKTSLKAMTVVSIFGLALGPEVMACAHGSTSPIRAEARARECPLAQLRGVGATVSDIGGGVAVAFSAPASEVDQLRENVQSMASMTDKHGDAFAACPCAAPMVHGATLMQGGVRIVPTDPYLIADRDAPQMPRANAKVVDTPTGATLVLTTREPGLQMNELAGAYQEDNIFQLRKAVHQDVAYLYAGCLGQGALPPAQ